MAFHFTQNEQVERGVERLLRERFDSSIQRFAEAARPTDPVHAVRKDIKKLRAILWLVRDHVDADAYRRQTDALREVAGLLASVRDTEVHLQTLKDLSDQFKGGRGNNAFRWIETILKEERRQARQTFSSTDAGRKAENILKSAKKQVTDLALVNGGNDWKLLSNGLRTTYKRGRIGFQECQRSGHAEEFHEWRKAVKRLWYQMRLLSPAWPAVLESFNDELESLGHTLGIDHDLFVLHELVGKQPTVPPAIRKTLDRVITERQTDLRPEALRLGAQIYCEKPSDFCQRIGCYWENSRRR